MKKLTQRRKTVSQIHNEDKLKALSESHKPSEIATIMGVDPRKVHRAMRNYGILDTQEPTESIKLRIKDTEKGRRLAEALGLEVGVDYPRT